VPSLSNVVKITAHIYIDRPMCVGICAVLGG